MKHTTTILLITLGLLSGCTINPDSPKPELRTEFTVKAIVNFESQQDKVISYLGDTAHYEINVSSSNVVKEVKFLRKVNGVFSDDNKLSIHIPSGDKKNFIIDFKYPISDSLNHSFQAKVTDEYNQLKEFIITNVDFKPQSLQEWTSLRLYNNGYITYLFGVIEDVVHTDLYYKITQFSNSITGGSAPINMLMKNTNTNTLTGFTKAWHETPAINNSFGKYDGTNSYVKANSSISYSNIQANQVIIYFKTNSNISKNEISFVNTGDIYIGKSNSKYNTDGYKYDPYYIIKITDIADDGRTAAGGGTDQDYIQFDIKMVNPNRFK